MDPVQPDDVYGTAVTFGGSDAFSIPFIGQSFQINPSSSHSGSSSWPSGSHQQFSTTPDQSEGDRLSAAADNIDRNIIFIVGLVIIIAIPIAVMGAVVNENDNNHLITVSGAGSRRRPYSCGWAFY